MAQRSRRAQRTSSVNIANITSPPGTPTVISHGSSGGLAASFIAIGAFLPSSCSSVLRRSVFVSKWNVIGPDIPLYFNFTHKSFGDLVEFWLLLFVMGFIHETAHGLTCKHFGGEVHSMGLLFLYLCRVSLST